MYSVYYMVLRAVSTVKRRCSVSTISEEFARIPRSDEPPSSFMCMRPDSLGFARRTPPRSLRQGRRQIVKSSRATHQEQHIRAQKRGGRKPQKFRKSEKFLRLRGPRCPRSLLHFSEFSTLLQASAKPATSLPSLATNESEYENTTLRPLFAPRGGLQG